MIDFPADFLYVLGVGLTTYEEGELIMSQSAESSPVYTKEEIDEICEEIERQWEYHLLARAAFPAGVLEQIKVNSISKSPPFYEYHGVQLAVCVPSGPLSPIMERSLTSVGRWLNQNYIIRLFGILDEYGVITKGKDEENPYTYILAELRHKVGAHTRGYANIEKSEFKKLNAKMNELFSQNISIEDIKDFNVSIDTVLFPLKGGLIEFVKSLQGKPKPDRKAKTCKSSGY